MENICSTDRGDAGLVFPGALSRAGPEHSSAHVSAPLHGRCLSKAPEGLVHHSETGPEETREPSCRSACARARSAEPAFTANPALSPFSKHAF
ncbi:hypothetical protein AAFF_G00025740 [Aldrovandia affinis]|uniref:Uncharacterized protein n=1 Tax=Aldrovandia affinis TaxID=143900 RepID=A0AAD7WGE7_9TELE|nr:hypothetical protein AAFF_G00025740 [Aldrovandia affinis]